MDLGKCQELLKKMALGERGEPIEDTYNNIFTLRPLFCKCVPKKDQIGFPIDRTEPIPF
jgi:hypothetical protein